MVIINLVLSPTRYNKCMLVYHELPSDAVGSVLRNGLKRSTHSDKSNDKVIIQTNSFLDKRRPSELGKAGVSRDNNIYAYICIGDSIVDIVDGRCLSINEFVEKSEQVILELDVDSSRCFVSDLDTYDALSDALKESKPQHILDELGDSYWNKMTKLSEFTASGMCRPEVLITYDVQASNIRKL